MNTPVPASHLLRRTNGLGCHLSGLEMKGSGRRGPLCLCGPRRDSDGKCWQGAMFSDACETPAPVLSVDVTMATDGKK